MEIIGRQIELGIGIEDTRGTAQTQAEKWLKKVTANVVERTEKMADPSTRNVLVDSQNARIMKKWVEGNLEMNCHADALGYLLYNLYGAISSANVAGSVYDHTFSLQNSIQHASLNLFAKDGGNSNDKFSNVMVNSMELSFSPDEFVKVNIGFTGKSSASASDTPSYDTEYDFVGKDVTVKFADTEAGLSGATAVNVKSGSVIWTPQLIRDHVIGSYNPDDIYNASMMLEADLVLNYEDDTYKDLYLAETAKYCQIQITSATTIGGSYYPTITIVMHNVQVMDWNREGGNDEIITQPIKIKAFYNETDSKQSEVVVRNLTEEYDTAVS